MSDYPQIPGLRIRRELGRGGMATVYLAFQEKLQREVAVKILSPHLLQDGEFTARFVKEAETAAKLHHSSIIPIYDIGESGAVRYIVMEYLEETLKDRTRKGPLDPQTALRILWQIADALAYAHMKGLVHRDIKPENIMFRGDGTAVLTDFGIAKAAGAASTLTKAGTTIGSPHYMSPEQAKGQTTDGRSDIYSLGAVFFEMLTGRPPYDAEDVFAVIVKHCQEPVPKFPGTSSRFQPLLDRMMAKRMEDRPQNAEQLLGLITQFWPLADQNGSGGSLPSRGSSRMTPAGFPVVTDRPAPGGPFRGMAPEKKRVVVPLLVALLVTLGVIIILLLVSLNKGEQASGGGLFPAASNQTPTQSNVLPPEPKTDPQANTGGGSGGTFVATPNAVPTTLRLSIFFLEPTWIQIYVDGALVVDEVKMAGEQLTFDCQTEFLINTGNAGGFSYMLDGRLGKSLGGSGESLQNIRITMFNYIDFLEGH
jgi:serine/threonine protein kinase